MICETCGRVHHDGLGGVHSPCPDGTNAGSAPRGRAEDERAAWDAFAIEAMRQILYMAPESLNWSDKLADTPALFADRVAEVADRVLEKRRSRFEPPCSLRPASAGQDGEEKRRADWGIWCRKWDAPDATGEWLKRHVIATVFASEVDALRHLIGYLQDRTLSLEYHYEARERRE